MKIIIPAAILAAVIAAPLRAEIIEQVLVKVNGDIITKTDLEARQIAALRERGVTGAIVGEVVERAGVRVAV